MSILSYFSDKKIHKTAPLQETAQSRGILSGRPGIFSSYNPDDLISKKGYAIYDEMQKDAQVQACLNIKKFAVLSNGWEIHPASESAKDIEIAKFVKYTLDEMRGSLLDVLFNALDAIAKGFSIMELNYKIIDKYPYKGKIGLSSIKSKDPSTFEFEVDEFLNIKSLVRTGFAQKQEKLPPNKFVIYTYMPTYESPYGTSDLRAAYKHCWSKDILTRFLNLYLEKYGSPTAKGSYKRGTPKSAQDELLRVLDKIQQETAIVIPEDVTIELLEAQRGGEAGYLQALQFHDMQISKSILGQTVMTDDMRVGSFALARIHLDVLKMCLKKLKRDLEESVMREQVIRPLVDYNFNTSSYPNLSLGNLEERDLESLANAISKLISGEIVSPDENWIREYLGIPEKSLSE